MRYIEITLMVVGLLVIISLPVVFFLWDTIAYWFHKRIENKNNKSGLYESYSKGVHEIGKERYQQIYKHGFEKEDDKRYVNGELVDAAKYILTGDFEYWPATWSQHWRKKFYSKNRKEQLITAGALLAAELDRMQPNEPHKNI